MYLCAVFNPPTTMKNLLPVPKVFWVFVLTFSGYFYTPMLAANPDTIVVKFSKEAGFYTGSVSVSLTAEPADATIYYTTNGSVPTMGSNQFLNPLLLDSTTVIQAVAYKGGRKSAVAMATYLFNENTTFPVVSIAIEPAYLFDNNSGLFKAGPRASKSFPHTGANYYSTRKHPCRMQIFEPDHSLAVTGQYFFSIFGGMSRIFPQKSISISAKDSLGYKRINHRIFPHLDIKSFKSIVLRNSGSDFGETHFRDAFITSLGKEMGLEVQAYRPSVVYINGKYWGILNFREKLNEHYIKDHFGYDKDSVDLMEHMKGVKNGSRKHYVAMQDYMRNNDLSVQEHFDKVATMMDVENFADYEIVEIYIDNQDAGGNIKFWRPQTPDGRWRWLLFDTDFGFGHYGRDGYKLNSLAFHTEANGPAWPNPAWSTFNLRMLLKNKGFRQLFVTRFLDRINTVFDSNYVIKRIDSMANFIRPEMPRHWARWELSEKEWTTEVDRMRQFARLRPAFMRKYLREMFSEFGGEVRLRIEIEGKGEVQINRAAWLKNPSFEGVYFENLPMQVLAKSSSDFQFSHWEYGGKQIKERTFKFNFKDTFQVLKAVFKAGRNPLEGKIIINEMAVHDSVAGDWIELFNNTSEAHDLVGWSIMDADGNKFTFPATAKIPAGGYLVLSQDYKQFKKAFPNVAGVGDFKFGLDKRKDVILLLDANDSPVDSVGYELPKDTKTATIVWALQDCLADNGLIQNWKLDDKNGSPAAINPIFVTTNNRRQIGNMVWYIGLGGLGAASLVWLTRKYAAKRKNGYRKPNIYK